MTAAANPIGPTVPNDIKNETVMRAWYQEMWSSVRDLTNERISVKDYGAAGDGTTDDTTAFVTALAVADDQTKVLWIPQGNYRITSTITLANPVTILGEGKSVSIIEPYLGTGGGDVFLITSSDVIMKDFGFDGSNVGSVTLTNNEFMIHVNPTSGTLKRHAFIDLLFQECDFKAGVKDVTTEADIRGTYCIKLEDTDNVLVEDCWAKNMTGGFVYTTGVNFIDIHRNYMEDIMLHPVCIHDTTNYFTITDNEFNPTDTEGVFLGGLIDVTSSTGTQCHHGNISGNRIKGIYNTSGYVSYGAVIRVLSSTDINISNNYMTEIMDGTLNADNDFVDVFNIKVGTYGTSSSDDNGPCKRISILNNYINGSRDTNTYHFGGILVENNYQTDNLSPAEDIRIIGNHLVSTAVGTSWLERGIVINGKSSGVKNVIIEDNYVTTAPETPASGVAGRGVVSVISDDSTGKCYEIFIGGNRIENLKNDGAIATAACLTIGQYTSEAFCTKPNYLKGYSYGVVIETGAGSNLWYWDDNYYEEAGANTTKFVFNVQPKSRHANFSGTTANRPTSAGYLTNYMTYFDTDVGTPLWYNGSAWVGAWGSADSIAETIADNVGTMVTGNTETGITVTYQDSDNTLDFVVSDLTVAGDTGSTGMTPGDTLTIAGGTGCATVMSGDTLTINLDSGFVNTTGTPADNQVAVFTDADTVEGTSALVFNGTTLSIGTTDSMTVNGSAVTSMLASNSNTQAIVETDTSSDTAGTGSVNYLARSRGTLSSRTVVQSGDTIGTIAAVGYDGADFALGSRIDFVVGTTPGLNDMPTNILFKVSADGAQNPTTAMTVNYNTNVSFAGDIDVTGDVGGTTIGGITEANLVDKSAAETITGAWDFGGATSLEIPNGAAPSVSVAGQIAVDTTITDYTGLIKYHDGVEELTVVAMPTANLNTTDTYVVSYNAANNEFTMTAQAGGSDDVGIRRSWFGI